MSIFEMHNGRFAYVNDWCASLQAHLSHINYSMKIVMLNLNIDGIPLFNDSRRFHAYPILIQVLSVPDKIICAGLYLFELSGKNKMPPENILLQKFLNDLQPILQ